MAIFGTQDGRTPMTTDAVKKYTREQLEAMPLHELKALADEEARLTAIGASPRQEEVPPADVDPEQLSLEELKRISIDAALKAEAEAAEPQKPANDGRHSIDRDGEEFVAKRTIDFGDGSGVQVFRGRGATAEEAAINLADVLLTAQRHATEKIRSQHAELLEKQTQIEKFRLERQQQLDDANYVREKTVQKKLAEKPVQTIEELARDAAKKVMQETTERQKRNQDAQVQWVAEHADEYNRTPRNGELMINEIIRAAQAAGRDIETIDLTLDDMDQAFAKLRDQLDPVVAEGSETAAPAPATPTRPTRRSSSISMNRSASPIVKCELSEEEMYKLPMDELRRRAELAARNANEQEVERYGWQS